MARRGRRKVSTRGSKAAVDEEEQQADVDDSIEVEDDSAALKASNPDDSNVGIDGQGDVTPVVGKPQPEEGIQEVEADRDGIVDINGHHQTPSSPTALAQDGDKTIVDGDKLEVEQPLSRDESIPEATQSEPRSLVVGYNDDSQSGAEDALVSSQGQRQPDAVDDGVASDAKAANDVQAASDDQAVQVARDDQAGGAEKSDMLGKSKAEEVSTADGDRDSSKDEKSKLEKRTRSRDDSDDEDDGRRRKSSRRSPERHSPRSDRHSSQSSRSSTRESSHRSDRKRERRESRSPSSERDRGKRDEKKRRKSDDDEVEEPKLDKEALRLKLLPELAKYWKTVTEDPTDFTGWTYLLQYVDQERDDEAARDAYNAFASRYPYCYGYWKKFSDYEKRHGNKEHCEEVFERGIKSIPLSVDLWLHFLNYNKANKEKDHIRQQFERAIEICGIEFRSDRLWEMYIKWEAENDNNVRNIMSIYDRLIATPTQLHSSHFKNLVELVQKNDPKELLSLDEFLELRKEVLPKIRKTEETIADATEEMDTAPPADDAPPPGLEEEEAGEGAGAEEAEKKKEKSDDKVTNKATSNNDEIVAIRELVIAKRKEIHEKVEQAVTARWTFEEGIKRPYFHVKPLERAQLKNWKDYIDFEIKEGDQKRIVTLFERCLIACALYEEFWTKYINYLEDRDDEAAANEAAKQEVIREVFTRACTIHLPKKPDIHYLWSEFEERCGQWDKASEILENISKEMPELLNITNKQINLFRRRGDFEKVSSLYEESIRKLKDAGVESTAAWANMVIRYARFLSKVLLDDSRAFDALKAAVEENPKEIRIRIQLLDHVLQEKPYNNEQTKRILGILDDIISNTDDNVIKWKFARRKVEFLEDFATDFKLLREATKEASELEKVAKEESRKKAAAEVAASLSDLSRGERSSSSGPRSSNQSASAAQQRQPSIGPSAPPSMSSSRGGSYSSSGSYAQPTAYQAPQQVYQPAHQSYQSYQPADHHYPQATAQPAYGQYQQSGSWGSGHYQSGSSATPSAYGYSNSQSGSTGYQQQQTWPTSYPQHHQSSGSYHHY